MRISVCIPTYEMKGKGATFLRQSLNILSRQFFKDFEVIISDNSEDDEIEKVCRDFSGLNINYFRNLVKGMAPNSNSAIKASRGELIKMLYLDDFLFGEDALFEISRNFATENYWLVTGCVHTIDGENYFNPHYALWNDKIYTGNNTIGSPSVLTVRNDSPLLFDESLTWVLDCDLYYRYYEKYGKPKVVDNLNVVIYQGEHQTSAFLSDEIKQKEYNYLINKYA